MNAHSETPYSLSPEDRETLLQLAKRSIEHGLNFRRALEISAREYSEPLQQAHALFVTLHMGKELRGCIGTTEATHPLVCNVAKYAYFAAFNDSRFSPLTWEELPEVSIQISILTPPIPMRFTSETDLVSQFHPGEDGLILEADGRRGTFLPSVWEMLPDPQDFWRQLKRKAGLSPDYWSANLKVSRYASYCISTESEP